MKTTLNAVANVTRKALGYLTKLRMNNIRILMPIIDIDPHLHTLVSQTLPSTPTFPEEEHTFRNVLNPARILPPIHVLYFLSGGANILILISLTASRCTSCSNLSPKPFVRVPPPERTMLPKRDLRRSMSVRLMASTTIWWMPGYSRPIISGSKRISGAR